MPLTLERVSVIRDTGGLPRIVAYNPNHDEAGRFAESAGEGGGGGGKKSFLQKVKERLGMTPAPSVPTDASFNGKLNHALSTQSNRVGPRGFPIVKVDGKEYLVKGGALKENEVLASQLGRENGINVAKVEPAQRNGAPVAAVEWHEGARSISQMKPAEARAALAAVPRAEVERHALFDYVIGNSDANQGNTIFTRDGRMVAIDKEFSLAPQRGADATAKLMPEHLRFIAPDNATGNFRFDRGNVDHMIGVGDRVAARLEGMGRASQAGGVRDRMDVLRQFAEHGDLTVRNLETLGAMGPRRS